MVRQKVVLISILLIVVIAMVYLSVEGFYVFLTNRELLQSKLGILPGMNTASMPAEELKRRMEWMADNAPSGSQKNLYDSIRNSGNLNEIQKLMKDPSAKLPKEWLTYFDDTDYENKICVQKKTGSECGYGDPVCTGSGSDRSCDIKKRTGSRLNTTANTRNPEYSNLDNPGGKYLTQCDSNDFNCIRNLSFADANYKPYSMPTSDLFGAFDDSLTKPFPNYTPGTMNPTGAGPSGPSAGPSAGLKTLPKTAADAITCMKDCIGKYGSSATNLDACSKLCGGVS